MTPTDPYALLGLTPAATDAEIKSAYRRLVRLYHPDNNPGFPEEAAAKLRELRDAHDQALDGWTPPPPISASWVAPAPAPRDAKRRQPLDGKERKEAKRRARAGGRLPGEPPPWTPPPPVRHENPPRRMDPPTVPPKEAPKPAPQPPEPKYVHVPPARDEAPAPVATPTPEELAAQAARRATLLLDLIATGFAQHVDEFDLDHAILDALLPVLTDGERVHACARYDDLASAGTPAERRHEALLLHPVPEDAPSDGVIASLIRGRFIACTERRLIWTVSRLAPASGAIVQERLDVHAEPLDAVARVSIMQGGLGIGLATGLAMRFGLRDADAAALERGLGARRG